MQPGYTKSWRKKYHGKTASRGILYIGAMDWLVGNANFRDGWADGQRCGRGQLFVGRADLARIWRVSERNVRTIMANLEKDGFLATQPTNRGTIVTITNYDTYQSDEEGNRPANRPPTGQQDSENSQNPASQPANKEHSVNAIQSSNNATDEEGHRPANRPPTGQLNAENRPLNKNNIYIYRVNQKDEKPQTQEPAWIPNRMRPPTKPEEVLAEAVRIGYPMPEERALEFIRHYESLGWRLNGGYILDWRKLLPRWKNNENRKGAINDKSSDYENDSRGRKRVANADEFTGISTPAVI